MLLQNKTCLECSETYFASANDDGVCQKCHRLKDEAKFEEHMNELKKLSIEERIERIEKILYDSAKNKQFIKLDVFY